MEKQGKVFVRTVMSLALAAFITAVVWPVPASAAEPDAKVVGLWLRCPSFPKDAEVISFENNEEMDSVEFTRSVDGQLMFSIMRQPIEESELREPGDVPGLVEMWVNNGEGDEGSMKVDTNAGEFAKLYTYPCATAEYTTGQNEDTRKNAALFIFTDKYSFIVEASVAADFAEDYGERTKGWLAGLEFVEGKN